MTSVVGENLVAYDLDRLFRGARLQTTAEIGYASASDSGDWCIYCEKENDVAVFATDEKFSTSLRLRVCKLLEAESIVSVSRKKEDVAFDFDKLTLHWKSTLIAEYTAE